MADSRDFKIRIITEADTAAAKEAGRSLEDIGQKGKAAHEEITEGAEHSHLSHRALNVALRQLGPEFSHLGHIATTTFFNPQILGILGATIAIGALIKHYEKLGEAAKEAEEKSQAASKNMLDSMRGAREEVEKLNTQTGTTVKNLDSIVKSFKDLKEPEKGLRTKEEVEKAMISVSAELAGIEKQTPEQRLTKIRALPAIAEAHEKEAEKFRKEAERYSNDPNAQLPGSPRAIAAEKATEESLAAIRARQELRFLQGREDRRRDLRTQLGTLTGEHENLTMTMATPPGEEAIPWQRKMVSAAMEAAPGQLGPQDPRGGAAIKSLADFMRAHGASQETVNIMLRELASNAISTHQKLADIQKMLRMLANKPT